jgi:hypothetical protein
MTKIRVESNYFQLKKIAFFEVRYYKNKFFDYKKFKEKLLWTKNRLTLRSMSMPERTTGFRAIYLEGLWRK